jgi:hypothetical protein
MMGGPDGQNPQAMQQQPPQQQGPPQQAMNQVFTQGQGQMPPSGYRPQQSIAPMSMSYFHKSYINFFVLIFNNLFFVLKSLLRFN